VEYETRIKRLESLLQERNAAQPHIQNQPLQPADPSVPATEWVTNLRNELPSIPRPDVPDLEALFGNAFVDHGSGLVEDLSAVFHHLLEGNSTYASENTLASMALDDIEPSDEFQEDAALLQSTDFDHDPLMEEFPPPLPREYSGDW
jgi:hypothetical protein